MASSSFLTVVRRVFVAPNQPPLARGQYGAYIFSNELSRPIRPSDFSTRRHEMSKSFSLAIAIAVLSIFCWGCTSDVTPPAATSSSTSSDDHHHEHGDHAHGDHDHAHAKLCGSCGDEKGSESCCSESAEACAGCGLTKGSKLCCVELPADAKGKDLCGSCGHVAGSESCCAEDAEKCECGMAKGSPLCCKLKTDA